jgi:signal transduction histidine kinase
MDKMVSSPMGREFFAGGMLRCLRPHGENTGCHEGWMLALSRIVFGICCFISAALAGKAAASTLCKVILPCYLAYGLVLFLTLRIHPRAKPMFHAGIHFVDVLWATQLIILINWPALSFATLFFVFTATALRWGFWGIQLTAATFCLLLLAGGFVYHLSFARLWHYRTIIDLLPEILLCAGLAIIAGLLAEGQIIRGKNYAVKAEAVTGNRIARELHDGVIQSLCCIDMRLEELRNRTGDLSAGGTDSILPIQESLRKEVAGLRDFMQRLRSLEIDSDRLPGYLAGLATKFEIEHGIRTRFVSDVDDVRLRPRVCVELARITQEALVNVRKHSQASEVLVRFGRRNGDLVLNIFDNGCGFGFSGRLSHEELKASGKGPRVILERAGGIKGKVSIESIESEGSCVEIALPHKANC